MNKKSMLPKLVFFGTPDFAVASLQALIQHQYPILAVITAPDRPSGRGRKLRSSKVKQFAEKQGLTVWQPTNLKDPNFLSKLRALEADLQIVVAFRMLPESVWAIPPMGTINVHGSLLPQYRGAAPINHALINGETETGVTTFQLKHEIDTGDLLLQQKVSIDPEDNFESLYNKLKEVGADLLIRTLVNLSDGTLRPRPQQVSGVLYPAPKIKKEDGLINWETSVERIHNLVRGLSPIPTAYFYLGELKLKIYATHYLKKPVQQPAGTWETNNQDYLKIAAKDGWVFLDQIQAPGKKNMGIKDFLNGNKLPPKGIITH